MAQPEVQVNGGHLGKWGTKLFTYLIPSLTFCSFQGVVSRSITKCAMAELPVPLAGDPFPILIANQLDSQTLGCDFRTTSLQASAAVEDTRLIPLRPTTQFAASKPSSEFIEKDKEEMSSSAPLLITLVSHSQRKCGSPDII